MESTLISFVHQLGTLEFWQTLLDGLRRPRPPLRPSFWQWWSRFFPPLPLIAIVALNVAAHGGLFGFVYSWVGVMLGGTLMFLFWRRVLKQFFWKFASRSQKLEKAEQWVSRFDVSSLFMLSVLPFTPSSFMHFAFGISDFDEKRYLITMLLGKGVMVAMMAPLRPVPRPLDEEPRSTSSSPSSSGARCTGAASGSAKNMICKKR